MKDTQFQRGTVRNVRVHVLPTEQFKTFALSVYIGSPLGEDTVTPNALIPFVLRRGSKAYPETKQFRERLDDMYGAGFGFDIYKRGDNQMIQFRMDVIQDDFVSSSKSLLQQAMEFMSGAITEPALEGNTLVRKYIESEKTTLEKRLQAIVNDKIKYAAERCIEEMCSGEPYRLHPLGKLDALGSIEADSLTTRFREMLHSAPIDVYVVGNTNLEQVLPLIERYFSVQRSEASTYSLRTDHRNVGQVKEVVERLDVNQGKLNMGLRVPTSYADESYPAALLYNGILGGYPHSKLFTNVREKASLAYYASSRLDGHKGIMTIQSGIEIGNYEKAVTIIKEQLKAMEEGNISETELQQTKAMISGHLRELQDSAFELIAFDFNNRLSGAERTVPRLIEQVEQTTPDQIRQMAQQVQLDTIYFLRDRKGGE
ncbi:MULTISPECIES: pitrilysin family protein [unclassified Paenibacillus]|uniref:EF-P 5-aminopentanol modification-associated protein YfmF n=1 Tax=unclassified Paenibacillus TaxID=185978 RepID=UPI001B41F8E4|nr:MULTISPECIES: pitrilysin family protein [unclassified Paenibacillus]MBP1155943.1 putative Zn-dependent peptidase [Paenibacillus sp. PvP091]MBP1168671.1 putative Zn-dependent peptidase [Paenibacillus sp. PvR098]MBP2439699.1 putative Zn-dependent peptidase [Paenibacillus sp. PvP052]